MHDALCFSLSNPLVLHLYSYTTCIKARDDAYQETQADADADNGLLRRRD